MNTLNDQEATDSNVESGAHTGHAETVEAGGTDPIPEETPQAAMPQASEGWGFVSFDGGGWQG